MREGWKFFLDQNIRIEVNTALRDAGIDSVHASNVSLQRASDPEIFQYATDNGRTLVTRDADFGDLNIFPLPVHHSGVIRLRIDPPLASAITRSHCLHFVKGTVRLM